MNSIVANQAEIEARIQHIYRSLMNAQTDNYMGPAEAVWVSIEGVPCPVSDNITDFKEELDKALGHVRYSENLEPAKPLYAMAGVYGDCEPVGFVIYDLHGWTPREHSEGHYRVHSISTALTAVAQTGRSREMESIKQGITKAQVGDRVRSFDFHYRELEGDTACYVEGIVIAVGNAKSGPYIVVTINVDRDIYRGERADEVRAVSRLGGQVYPPQNGTPSIFGGVTDGIHILERAG